MWQDRRSTFRGIMSLEGKYGLDRLAAACACAAEGRLYGYNEVREILEKGDGVNYMPTDEDARRGYRPQQHGNIRGKDYYASTGIGKEGRHGDK